MKELQTKLDLQEAEGQLKRLLEWNRTITRWFLAAALVSIVAVAAPVAPKQKPFEYGRVKMDKVQKYQDEEKMISPNCPYSIRTHTVSAERAEEAALRFAAMEVK